MKHLTYANVMATLAVLLSMGGTAYALTITSADIKDNTIRSRDIKNYTITGNDIGPGRVTGFAIQDKSVTEYDLARFSVAEKHMDSNAITSWSIKNGEIRCEDLDASLQSVTGC